MVDPEEERYVAEEQLANGSKDCVAIANCHLEKKVHTLSKGTSRPCCKRLWPETQFSSGCKLLSSDYGKCWFEC